MAAAKPFLNENSSDGTVHSMRGLQKLGLPVTWNFSTVLIIMALHSPAALKIVLKNPQKFLLNLDYTHKSHSILAKTLCNNKNALNMWTTLMETNRNKSSTVLTIPTWQQSATEWACL